MSRIFQRFTALISTIIILLYLYLAVPVKTSSSNAHNGNDSIWIQYYPYFSEIFPDSKAVIIQDKIKTIINNKGEKLGIILISNECKAKIYGYGGEIILMLIIDKTNIIRAVHVLRNDETPAFYNKVVQAGLLNSWNLMPVANARNSKADAVSGATITSDAIINAFHRTVSWYLNDLNNTTKINRNKFFIHISIGLVLILALLHYYQPDYFKKSRWLLQIASIIIIGFLSGGFISAALLYGWLIHGISFQIMPLIVIIFSISVCIPLFSRKAFYCNFICPYGACQELAGKIYSKKITFKPVINKILRYTRSVLFFILVFVLMIWSNSVDLSLIEPFMAFIIKSLTWYSLTMAVVFIIISVFINRPWCNYFCMTGQLFEMMRRPILNFSDDKYLKRNILFALGFLLTGLIIIVLKYKFS